jgi:2,4-didehydro-3-deoxy-L-rhamnonate hydrolase
MRFANHNGRLGLVVDGGIVDVADASGGALPSRPAEALTRWDEVLRWAGSADQAAARPFDERELGAPSPEPGQVFAIGLNYAPHAAESGFTVPSHPFVFTKTTAALAGPFGELPLPSATIDWEVELVAVIGRTADTVRAEDAWAHIAGLTVGQDFSDREVQNRLGANSQPTLGKSRPGFAPTGPYLVTPDEFADPDDIPLSCVINGETVQSARTSELIFGVPRLVEYLSAVLPLQPGDLIFTGTPAGVGIGRTPAVYLRPGDVVETTVDGIGTIRQVATAGAGRP